MSSRAETDRLAGLIGLRGADVISFDPHVDGAHPYLEMADDGLVHWRVRDHGQLLEDRTTRDPDEVLYWAFVAATWQVASDWELRHRAEEADPRVGVWAKQAELLARLDPVWAQRWRRELAARIPHDVDLLPDLG